MTSLLISDEIMTSLMTSRDYDVISDETATSLGNPGDDWKGARLTITDPIGITIRMRSPL